MCAFVTFLHNPLYIFIYEDIFTKFAVKVYGCESMSVKNFVLILKHKIAPIADCLKIINMF